MIMIKVATITGEHKINKNVHIISWEAIKQTASKKKKKRNSNLNSLYEKSTTTNAGFYNLFHL